MNAHLFMSKSVLPRNHRITLFKIVLASPTESAMTEVSLGDGRLMSSRANRTAAMMDAAIASVEANRSVIRRCSSFAFARFISPIAEIIGE